MEYLILLVLIVGLILLFIYAIKRSINTAKRDWATLEYLQEKADNISTKEELVESEQKYLDNLNPFFNIRTVAENNLGIKTTEEVKEKLEKVILEKFLQRFIKNA